LSLKLGTCTKRWHYTTNKTIIFTWCPAFHASEEEMGEFLLLAWFHSHLHTLTEFPPYCAFIWNLFVLREFIINSFSRQAFYIELLPKWTSSCCCENHTFFLSIWKLFFPIFFSSLPQNFKCIQEWIWHGMIFHVHFQFS
jgi:hypothetical protein